MFNDYPHKNKFFDKKSKKILKSLSNKRILRKEFLVLDFLQDYNFVPRVSNFDGNKFEEEFIHGRELERGDLNDDNIEKLALTLKKLHSLEILPDLEKLLDNKLLFEHKYNPNVVVESIFGKAPRELEKKYKSIFYNLAKELKNDLDEKNYNLSLIHGDLSFHNIFLKEGKIFLIDWTDCRLDISSCDVSQLFYLLKFDKKQEDIFLKFYDTEYIDNGLLFFHKALLFLYDLVDFYLKNKKIDYKLSKNLDLLLEKNER